MNLSTPNITARRDAALRMEQAKRAFNRAARATLQGLPLATAMTTNALEDIERARDELRVIEGKP